MIKADVGLEQGQVVNQLIEQLLQLHHGQTVILPAPISSISALPDKLKASNFDLSLLVDDCVTSLKNGRTGLRGFAISCDDSPEQVLEHLCQRVYDEWQVGKVNQRTKGTLKPTLNTSVNEALFSIARYKNALKVQHVLCPFNILDGTNVSTLLGDFWRRACEEFPDSDQHSHCLILIMAVPSLCDVPSGVVPLGTPQFTREHIDHWVRQVLTVNNWDFDKVHHWKPQIVAECCIGGVMSIRLLYEYLNDVLKELQKCPSWDDFARALDDRSQLYASTSN